MVVVTETGSGVATAFVEMRICEILSREWKVDRKSIHCVPKHCCFAIDVIVVKRPATGDSMHVVALRVVEMASAIVKRRDGVRAKNRTYGCRFRDDDSIKRDPPILSISR